MNKVKAEDNILNTSGKDIGDINISVLKDSVSKFNITNEQIMRLLIRSYWLMIAKMY